MQLHNYLHVANLEAKLESSFFSSVTIVTVLVTFSATIYHTLTPPGCVTATLNKQFVKRDLDYNRFAHIWSPSKLSSHPTNFCSTVRAANPITAPFFQQKDLENKFEYLLVHINKNHLAARTMKSFSLVDQVLKMRVCKNYLQNYPPYIHPFLCFL